MTEAAHTLAASPFGYLSSDLSQYLFSDLSLQISFSLKFSHQVKNATVRESQFVASVDRLPPHLIKDVQISRHNTLIAHGGVLIVHGRIDCSSSLSLSLSEVFPLSQKRNDSFQPVSSDAGAIKYPCVWG